MTVYRTGRSTDYAGAEAPPKRQYPLRKINTTSDAIDQFWKMAQGYAPVCTDGSGVAWVKDDTLTSELRDWCAETAHQIEREAKLGAARKPRAASPLRRNVSQIESEIAAVLALRPDATAHDIRLVTGIEHSRILRTEAWQMAHMGKVVKQ